MTSVNPDQLRNQVKLLTAEVEFNSQELDRWKKRGEAERNLYHWFADCMIDPGQSRVPLQKYTQAHKEHYQAKTQLKELNLAKIKSQLAIATAMLEEAENVIKQPKGNLITS
jgi:hypothetical protein